MLYKFKRCLLVIFCICFTTFFHCNLLASDEKSDEEEEKENLGAVSLAETILNLTCETQGIGNLLRTEFAHTCVPQSFATFAVANIISPGVYATFLLKLKLNDDNMFPNACARENRIDFYDKKIDFAICNNVKLFLATVQLLIDSFDIIGSTEVEQNPEIWNDLGNRWTIKPDKYHDIFKNEKPGSEGVVFDVGVSIVLPWRVEVIDDRICVMTFSFFGWIPVGCRYLTEPYPHSIYADFMHNLPDLDNLDRETVKSLDPKMLVNCSNGGNCFKDVQKESRTGLVMSSPVISCVKEMVAKSTTSETVCGQSGQYGQVSMFRNFQKNMRVFVQVLLALYVVFFGMKMALMGTQFLNKKELSAFIAKFVFVTYFSIGFGDSTVSSGMTDIAFPILMNGISTLSSWVVNASPSELCVFDQSEYKTGFKYLAAWDSLDCKIGHYLGLDVPNKIVASAKYAAENGLTESILSTHIPPYVYLLIIGILIFISTTSTAIIAMAMHFPLLIISVAAFVVNMVVVCIILISILGILAPLFVPLYLFKYTEQYFLSWLKLLMSFMLQPMVAMVFLTMMFSVYDYGFYGTCKYRYENIYNITSIELAKKILIDQKWNSSEDLKAPRKVKTFFVDSDWSSYSHEEKIGCEFSIGYILNNPVATLVKFFVPGSGTFFATPKVLFQTIKRILLSLLVAYFIMYVLSSLADQLNSFTADMTEGISLDGAMIGAKDIYKAGNQAISAIGSAGGGGEGGADADATRAGDKSVAGDVGKEASDKVSSSSGGGSREASDKISTSDKGSDKKKEGLKSEKSDDKNENNDSISFSNSDENSSNSKSDD